MKTAPLCLCLLVGVAHAQPRADVDFVSRLASDLLPLKSLPRLPGPLEDKVNRAAALQAIVTPEQNNIIRRYGDDLTRFALQRTLALQREDSASTPAVLSFFSWDQAYKLTSALAGQDLSEKKLTPLTLAILGMLEGAIVCWNTSSRLQDSAAFRTSVEQAYTALRNLGVSDQNTGIVMDSLVTKAINVAEKSPPHLTYK